jgi:hypothetical protein
MTTTEHLLATMPIAVADRVMTAVYEDVPVDPVDAATLATWMQDACAVLAGVRPVETMEEAQV